jgi:hypothetical protein
MNAALKIAEALCIDPIGIAELLPSCESGMVSAINEKLSSH